MDYKIPLYPSFRPPNLLILGLPSLDAITQKKVKIKMRKLITLAVMALMLCSLFAGIVLAQGSGVEKAPDVKQAPTIDCAKYPDHTACKVEKAPEKVNVFIRAYRILFPHNVGAASASRTLLNKSSDVRQAPTIKEAPTIDCATYTDHTDCLVEYLNRSVMVVPGKISCEKEDCILNEAKFRIMASLPKVRCATYREAGEGTVHYTDCYVEYANNTLKEVAEKIVCNKEQCILQEAPGKVENKPGELSEKPGNISEKPGEIEKAPEKVGFFKRFFRIFFPGSVVEQKNNAKDNTATS